MMAIQIGAAPCSWGVEFADAPENPPWQQVLEEARGVGYRGIELGPVGYRHCHVKCSNLDLVISV